MLLKLLYQLKNAGKDRVLTVVHPRNGFSLRMQRSLGFDDYQVIRYRRFWYLRYYTINKAHSSQSKTIITIFRSPTHIWRAYLPS